MLTNNRYREVAPRSGIGEGVKQEDLPRNTTTIEVESHNVIDWTLSQGQYLMIVAMIQQVSTSESK